CLSVAVLTMAARAAEPADAELTAFFRAYLDDAFRLRPLDATKLGDHRFDDRLDDLSPTARAAWSEQTRKTLEELEKRIDRRKLSRSGQIDYEILKHHLTREIWLAENTRPFEDDPRTYNEYLSDSIYLQFAQSSLPRATSVKNAAARIAYMPRVVAAAKENLKNPPRVFVETAIRQNRGTIAFYEHGLF